MGREIYSHRRWRTLRLAVLNRDGWRCQIGAEGCTGAATEVDHIVPVLVDPMRQLDPLNCRASCQKCNRGRVGGRRSDMNRPSREW